MLDNLSRGRLEVGLGRGISAYELGFFDISVEQSRAMFQEALDILLMGLRTGRVSYEGEHYTFKDVDLPLKAWQRPYPPLWYPTANPDSIRWAASQGISTVSHYPPMEVMREHIELYKSVWAEHQNDPARLNAHEPAPKYGITPPHLPGRHRRPGAAGGKAAFADFIANFNHLRILNGDDTGRTNYLADFEGTPGRGAAHRRFTGDGTGNPAAAPGDYRRQLLCRLLFLWHPHPGADAELPAAFRRGSYARFCRSPAG